jgi:membrane protein implicated in regulation of membrane protease activity
MARRYPSILAVGILYLAALIIGLGTIGVQLFMSGDGDTDSTDVDADVDSAGGKDVPHADAGFIPILLSLRFWTFGLMAFGMVGSLLHFFRLASGAITPFVAIGLGLLSGFFASWVFRALAQADTTSGANSRDAVGQVGKVLVPPHKGGRGKVRIELRGQMQDFLLETEEDALQAGDLVLVEDVRENVLQVARAPKEFLPPKS